MRVQLRAPFAPFLYSLFDWSGFVVSPTAAQKLGADFGVKGAVGTGPFRFAEYVKDQQTVVERNPDYWDSKKASLEKIVFRPIPVDSTRLTELRSGGVQLSEDLPYQDVARMRQMQELVLSEKTVSTHVSHLLSKTGTSNRVELAGLVHRVAPETGRGD